MEEAIWATVGWHGKVAACCLTSTTEIVSCLHASLMPREFIAFLIHSFYPFYYFFKFIFVICLNCKFCRKLKIGNKNLSLKPLIGCGFGSVFQVESGPQGSFLSPSQQGMPFSFIAFQNNVALPNNWIWVPCIHSYSHIHWYAPLNIFDRALKKWNNTDSMVHLLIAWIGEYSESQITKIRLNLLCFHSLCFHALIFILVFVLAGK